MIGFRNMTRYVPLYPGQWGIPGSDNELGIRAFPDAITLYVDSGHAAATDNNDGTDPNFPKLTIQGAVNALAHNGDQIVIAPGSYSESIITPDYVTGPNYVHIMGTPTNRQAVQWSSDDNNASNLDLRALGWKIEGLKFLAPTNAACIELRHTDSGANDIAINTEILHNHFYGQTTGLYGIETHGCYLVRVEGNIIENFNNVGNTACGIISTTTPLAIPYRNWFLNNIFAENDNHFDVAMNGSLFADNRLMPGYTYVPIVNVRTSQGGNPGDDNVVTANYFPGDYSIAGGYVAGAADEWAGNFASDIAEAEVGDNAITTARPT